MSTDPAVVAIWILRFLLATFGTVAAWWILKRTGPWLQKLVARIDKRLKARGRGVSLVSVELMSVDSMLAVIRAGIGTVRYGIMFLTGYVWLLLVTWALDVSGKVFDAVVQPLVRAASSLANAVIDFVPNLAMVVVIIVVARFSANAISLFGAAVEDGRIEFPWLDRDLVLPTRRLAVIAVWLIALIMAVPYLPGSESKAFFGVGLALAVIVSLGSGSATANLLGGLVLTYTRAFHVGDRVQIGEIDGEIVSLGAFSTRLRTPQNEEVVIPNSLVQSGTVKNYTTHAKREGVAVAVKVSVGYETPWRKVHDLLMVAAKHTMGVRKDPEPFVVQRALGDSAVDYELRAHTERSHELELVIARLHQAVQDAFFREGVEIGAPKLSGVREVKSPRVPEGRKNKAMEFQLTPSQEARVQPAEPAREAEPSFVVIAETTPKPPPPPVPPKAAKEEEGDDTEVGKPTIEPHARPQGGIGHTLPIEPMPIVGSKKKDETIVGLGAPKIGSEKKGEPGDEKP